HFVSDDAINSVGLFIDDVEIFTENPVEIADREKINPTEYKLEQNFPNPFNPTTTISYSLPRNCHVTITIYDISGREIITLRKENETAGYRSITWDGQDKNGSIVHSGVYIYNILTDKYRASKKMLFLK
ncbi:MAG: T9SS type A sorting domain-containing protein, partial [Candidatus Marinimicrobia bacterium]|nr:T9SS type A sorting domain-containing protein [Candidatus Neomarinimicrobiota bacterium]